MSFVQSCRDGTSISSLVTVHWPFSFPYDLGDHAQIPLLLDVCCQINPATTLDEIRELNFLWKTSFAANSRPSAILMNRSNTFLVYCTARFVTLRIKLEHLPGPG